MKIGDTIKFKKVKWTITAKKVSFPALVPFCEYRVHRKYFRFWLSNTKKTYCIFPRRWEKLKEKLKEDKNFYPNQLLGIFEDDTKIRIKEFN